MYKSPTTPFSTCDKLIEIYFSFTSDLFRFKLYTVMNRLLLSVFQKTLKITYIVNISIRFSDIFCHMRWQMLMRCRFVPVKTIPKGIFHFQFSPCFSGWRSRDISFISFREISSRVFFNIEKCVGKETLHS